MKHGDRITVPDLRLLFKVTSEYVAFGFVITKQYYVNEISPEEDDYYLVCLFAWRMVSTHSKIKALFYANFCTKCHD